MNVDSIIESRTRSRSAFTRMIGKVLPKMTPQLAAGFVVAALLGVMYPAFAYVSSSMVDVDLAFAVIDGPPTYLGF